MQITPYLLNKYIFIPEIEQKDCYSLGIGISKYRIQKNQNPKLFEIQIEI